MTKCKVCGRPLQHNESTCSNCKSKVKSPASSLFDQVVQDTKKSMEEPQAKQQVKNNDNEKNNLKPLKASNSIEPQAKVKTANESKQKPESQQPKQIKQKSPFLKRLKKFVLTTVAVIVVCFVALIIIGMQLDDEKVSGVEELYEPFLNKDVDALYSNLSFPEDTYYEKQSVKKYLSTLNLEEIGQQIEQFMNDDTANELVIYAPETEFELFVVKKNGDAFNMIAIANDVDITTNVQNAVLTLGEKAIEMDEQEMTIPLVFGVYEASLKGEMNGFDVALDKELLLPNDEGFKFTATVETYDVQYNSNYPEMLLEINGKKFESAGSFPRTIKGIPVGTELEIYGVIEEGSISYKSDVVKVSEEKSIELQFPAYEEMLQQEETATANFEEHEMYDFASEVVADFLSFYEQGAIDDMYTVLDPTSKIFDEHTALMQRLKDNGTTVSVESYTVDHFVEITDGQYELLTTEYFRIDKTSGTNFIEQKTRYKLAFVEGMLYINSIELM